MGKRLFSLIHKYTCTYICACIIHITIGSFISKKYKNFPTQKFTDMTAEGFKINSKGGSERHTQEGKGNNHNMLHIKNF